MELKLINRAGKLFIVEVKTERKPVKTKRIPIFNFLNICRFSVNFPDLFATRNSIVYLFFLFRLAQLNRKMLFNFYCTSCFLVGIATRYWRHRFNIHWDFNFLLFPSYHYHHLYYFEYLILNISPQQLDYDTFYYGFKNPYMAKHYNNFFVRVNFYMFIIIWKAMAHLRATCYSHYIRSHFFINHPAYRHCRFALTRQWARYFDREHRPLSFRQLSFRFLLGVYSYSYQIYLFDWAKPVFHVPVVEWAPKSFSIKNDNFIRFLLGIAKIPTKFFKFSRFLRVGIHQWTGLIANSIMARYTNHFTQYTRLDYEHGPILFKVLSYTVFSRNRLLAMWLGEWKDELFTRFADKSNFSRLFTVFDFLLTKRKIATDYDLKPLFPWICPSNFLFTYKTNKLYINDDLDASFFTNFNRSRCLDGHNPVMGDSWHVYEQFWRQYLLRYDYFGNFHYVGRFVTRNPLNILYYHWRIFNISPVYNFLQGRLPLRFFYRKVELDYLICYRYRWLWTIFKRELPPRFFHTFCKPIFKFRKKFDDSRYLVTPFPLRHTIRLALKTWYFRHGHKKVKPKISLKLTSFVGFSMIASLFVELFFKSIGLNFIIFFLLWNPYNLVYHVNWSFWQSRSLTLLYINQWAIRQWITNYQIKWSHYRRKISMSGIHSLTNPFFRENWIRVFHKCRRAGFKRHELPYYCYDESADLIADLASLIKTSKDNDTIFYVPGISLVDENPKDSRAFTHDLLGLLNSNN